MMAKYTKCILMVVTLGLVSACGDDGGSSGMGSDDGGADRTGHEAPDGGDSNGAAGNGSDEAQADAGAGDNLTEDDETDENAADTDNVPEQNDAGRTTAMPEPEPEPDPELPTIEGDDATEFSSELPSIAAANTGNGSVARDATLGGAVPGATADSDTTAPSAGNGTVEQPVAQPAPAETTDPARAIAEADIVQIQGDTLYALSSYNGLSVIDVSDPADLQMLGIYRILATPFEMYVQGDVVVGMFNNYSTYRYDEEQDRYVWETSSRVQALDTSDPRNIRVIGDHNVPGNITDSRMVGEVMYLVTEQWRGCWGCEEVPNTTVTSFDTSDPTAFEQVDQLRFDSPEDVYTGDRTVAVSEERIYISGWEWRTTANANTQVGSIQVVDISDPQGALAVGDKFDVGGQIVNRWQMDEYQGVLRVISQAGLWNSLNPPLVETFQINSSMDLQPLGSLTMQLPRPENLRSVRFDGQRGYATTVEQTDPLFTIDLSDPGNPMQRGDVEVPGWVYHMEPRGDRIYAVGFDQQNADGALHVTLFDVSDFDNPTLIDRFNFGGAWAQLAEDQDRIHKSFKLLDEQGLIVVPYSGWEYDQAGCQTEYNSGIQLVDFTEDTLVGRGVAPQIGSARRALVHRDHLFGISDSAVQTFDISDRDAPETVDTLDVARNISHTRVVGDYMMRFGNDWWTNRTILDMTPLDDADRGQPLAEVNLSELFGETGYDCEKSVYWSGQVYVNGNYAYAPRYETQYYDDEGLYKPTQTLTFYVVDMSDGDHPRPVGKFRAEPAQSNEYIGAIVQTESALLIGRTRYIQIATPNPNGSPYPVITYVPQFSYEVFDIRDPETPVATTRFDMPRLMTEYGWGWTIPFCAIDMRWGWWGGYYYPYYNPYYYSGGYGFGATLVSGDVLASQHYEMVDYSGKVKYFLDRLDVSDPEHPALLDQVNIPGSVVHYDHDAELLLTLDYQRKTVQTDDFTACYQRGAYSYWDETLGECSVFERSLNSLQIEDGAAKRLSMVEIDDTWRTTQLAVSDERVFVSQQQIPVNDEFPISEAPKRMRAYRTTSAGEFQEIANVPLEDELWTPYGSGGLRARGRRAFETTPGQMLVLDTTDATDPSVARHEMPGWSCASLEVSKDAAYCALGLRGVEVFPLD